MKLSRSTKAKATNPLIWPDLQRTPLRALEEGANMGLGIGGRGIRAKRNKIKRSRNILVLSCLEPRILLSGLTVLNGFDGSIGVNPPDTMGAVGPNHLVVWRAIA